MHISPCTEMKQCRECYEDEARLITQIAWRLFYTRPTEDNRIIYNRSQQAVAEIWTENMIAEGFDPNDFLD